MEWGQALPDFQICVTVSYWQSPAAPPLTSSAAKKPAPPEIAAAADRAKLSDIYREPSMSLLKPD